jgi:parallel beta-helix repeat protein
MTATVFIEATRSSDLSKPMHFRALLTLALFVALPEVTFMAGDATTLMVGPGNSIQAAIFEAKPSDTIIVKAGEYYEHLKVDKPIHLKGIGWPVLDATASGSSVTIKVNGTTVEGFRIKNAGSLLDKKASEAGIKVLSSDNRIEGNNVSNNFNGLLIQGGRNNTITNNIVDGNLGFGIRLERAMDNMISNNSLEDNSHNSFDSGSNLWDHNRYGDYDLPEEGCRDRGDGICQKGYTVPGGLNVDAGPRIKES